MKCPNCGADIPEVSRFCLSCGKDVPPPKEATVEKDDGSDFPVGAIMLYGLAFMMMFFAIMPMVMGFMEGAIAMMAVGAVMVLAGVYIQRMYKKPVVVKQEPKPEKVIKIKCRYCGKLHDPDDERCDSCGATL
jgi:hypothetical protein